MTDTKSNKSKKTLVLRDFKEDWDERFVFSQGSYEIMFFCGFVSKPKRYIQVWYKEKDKRYLRDEAIMDWEILRGRVQIDERNKRFWDTVNKFYDTYFNE